MARIDPSRAALRRLAADLDAWRDQGRLAAHAAALLESALAGEGAGSVGAGMGAGAALAERLGLPSPATADEGLTTSRALPADWPGRPGITGEVYLELLSRLDGGAVRTGQVFTPWPLARRLAGLLEPAPGQRWLDPAAGAGILLQAAREGGVEPVSCQALEPDPVARWMGQALVPGSRWRGGDALAQWEDLPADWRGGFDRVILNPPYRNGVERRDPAWVARRRDLCDRFATARGSFDLYMPFVERALDFLRPGGRLGLLVPIPWLAGRGGAPLRVLLAERARLLRLQHAPGCRLFPRAGVESLLLVVERRGSTAEPAPDVVVERLDRHLKPLARHRLPQDEVTDLAVAGWGPLLHPPARRRHALTPPLGREHAVLASLSAAEFYTLDVVEAPSGDASGLRLISSGAIEPFRVTWGERPVRFRGAKLARPVVREESLAPSRRGQAARPRVLIANLSRTLEAVAVAPGTAVGVVNVVQVLCRDLAEARALAAWLNSGPVQDWVRTWHDPLRLGSQLSLTRELVRGLPAPPGTHRPGEARDARRLAHLGGELAALAAAGRLDTPEWRARQTALGRLAARWLPRGRPDAAPPRRRAGASVLANPATRT